MEKYQVQFEKGIQGLVDHFVEEATASMRRHCAQQVAQLTQEIHQLTQQIRRWPIVGTEDVKVLRRAVHDQVALWFDQTLPDLAVNRVGSSLPALERHLAARYAAHNALYRAIEDQFQIPELKALPQEDVTAALAFIRQQSAPLAGIWRAVIKKAIHQRIAFWLKRGLIASTPSAVQGVRQILWTQVRLSQLDPSSELDRKRMLRLVDRFPVPSRYRAAR